MLYFAYTARLDPALMASVAPGAEFRFVAHLPDHGLRWPLSSRDWDGHLPTIAPDPAATVWGVVFAVPDDEFPPLDDAETAEGRATSTVHAIDRTGKRHPVTVHAAADSGNGHSPSPAYVDVMLAASRHWSLPAGWIAGLEELRT